MRSAIRLTLVALAVGMLVLLAGCSSGETTTGEALRFETTSNREAGGDLETVSEAIVKLDDGTEVRAIIPDNIDMLESGSTLELEKVEIDGEERWQVKKVVAEP